MKVSFDMNLISRYTAALISECFSHLEIMALLLLIEEIIIQNFSYIIVTVLVKNHLQIFSGICFPSVYALKKIKFAEFIFIEFFPEISSILPLYTTLWNLNSHIFLHLLNELVNFIIFIINALDIVKCCKCINTDSSVVMHFNILEVYHVDCYYCMNFWTRV